MTVTLLALMLGAANALDDLGVYTVASSTSSTVTSAALVDGTAGASVDRYNGSWAYAGAQQRVVRTSGLVPSTGQLTIRPNWTSAPAAGLTLYLTRLFPMDAGAAPEDISYRSIAVAALALLARQGITESPILKDATAYDMPGWLDRQERLIRVTEPHPRGRQPLASGWRGWQLLVEGETPRLTVAAPFSATAGTLTVEAIRPLHTWVATAGIWAESAAGPVNDTDQVVLGSVQDALPAMLYVAYRALAARPPGRPSPKATELLSHWEGEARRSALWDRTREPAPAASVGAPA